MRAALLVLLCAVAFNAIACSCGGPGAPAREFAQNDAVFLARVVNVASIKDFHTRLEVIRTWKGNVPKTVELALDVCGYMKFEAGREYLVYAHTPPWMVSMCSRTRPAGEAQIEMRILDALRAGKSEASIVKELPELMLHDARPAVRSEAARLLARDTPQEVAVAAVPSFVRALRDPSAQVRKSVIAALDSARWLMVDDPQHSVVRAFIEMLDDRDAEIRAQIARSLEKGWLVPETEPALRARLDVERDRAVLSKIAWTLAVIGSRASKRRVVPLLVQDLESSESWIRREAAERLGKIGPDARAAAQPLAALLRDKEEWVRYYAAGALGEIGSREAVPHLLAALDDPKPDVRAQAALAIFMTEDDATLQTTVIPVLIRSLETAKEFERYHLIRVLGEIGPAAREAVPALSRLLLASRPSEGTLLADALRGIGPRAARAVPAILFVLAESKERLSLVRTLEAINDRSEPVVRALEERLQDRDEHVRVAAAAVLAKWRIPSGSAFVAKLVPPLVEQLSNEKTRRHAVHRLNELRDVAPPPASAVPALRRMLSVADDRRPAIFALGSIGSGASAAVPDLIAALRDPDAWTRAVAAEGLRRIGTSEAMRAFDAFAPAEVAAHAQQLRNGDDRERGEAARCLVHLAPHSAAVLDALIAALDDPYWLTRTKSAEALGALGKAAASAKPALIRALDDRNAYVRTAAAAALSINGV